MPLKCYFSFYNIYAKLHELHNDDVIIILTSLSRCFHHGQHIIHNSNNLGLWTWWKSLWYLETTCKYTYKHQAFSYTHQAYLQELFFKHQASFPLWHQGKIVDLGWIKCFLCRTDYCRFDPLNMKSAYLRCSPWAYVGTSKDIQ